MNPAFLYIASRAVSGPLEALYTLLIFILSKELDATALQLTVLAASKPVVSLISFNVNGFIIGKPHRVRLFLLAASIIGALPCLFFPWIKSPWYYIVAYAIFITALRASFPAWMEILKNNNKEMASTVAKGSAVNYFIVLFVPLLASGWMDSDPHIWKILYVVCACFQLLNVVCIACLELIPIKIADNPPSPGIMTLWKEGWNLLAKDIRLTQYHVLFFLGGAGLVALQPVLPFYFKESLHLSYTQLTLAFSLCKGIAFVMSSPFWVGLSRKVSLYLLNGWIGLFSVLFILFLATAGMNTYTLFPAYLMYGAMQAGCELSWNLSGPYFARENESTLYSSLNLALVGIRGCIFPFVGSLLFTCSNAFVVFICAGILCVYSIVYALRRDRTDVADLKLV